MERTELRRVLGVDPIPSISMITAVALAAFTFARAEAAPPPTKDAGKKPFVRPPVDPSPDKPWDAKLLDTERRITILGTNDIHGGLEPSFRGPVEIGGVPLWSGVVGAIRKGLAAREGDRAGVLLVDAGDQFQGTFISNVSEGRLMLTALSQVGRAGGGKGGYDALVPGNHDYDFGPRGWKVDEARTDNERRESLLDALGSLEKAGTALISANTFLLSSIAYTSGAAKPSGVMCQPENTFGRGGKVNGTLQTIDWAHARQPEFLKPYVIREAAGVKVALIGLDNPGTPTTTTARNVDDLCFSDEVAAYRRVYDEIVKAGAEVFVIVAHDGNVDNDRPLDAVIKGIKGAGMRLDAVVSGHTHRTYAEMIEGIPVVQSGSGGKAFGRIDLVWDAAKKALVADKTKLGGGIELIHGGCDRGFTKGFCSAKGGKALYEGQPADEDADIAQAIRAERARLPKEEALATAKLGTVDGDVRSDRISESALANAITDGFRAAAQADIAMVNTGGLRAPIVKKKNGEFNFEDLFFVLPFSNHGVLVDLDANTLEALLLRSIRSCGSYGALMQSGLRVEFERNCKGATDEGAKLLSVKRLDGTVLFDAAKKVRPPEGTRFKVATFDFLAAGGSGYVEFKQGNRGADLGILRDVLAARFAKENVQWKSKPDGRWKQVNAAPPAGATAGDSNPND